VRVLIADDQRVIREGLAMLLGLLPDVEVVGEAGDGEEAVALAVEREADIVLMDLRMPRLDGAAATRLLTQRRPDCAVLVLTTYADDESIFDALGAGARGYLTKNVGADELARAITKVAAGETVLEGPVQERVLAAALQRHEPPSLPDELTPREAEVLALIAEGLSNAEIAHRLTIGVATVKTHVNRIFLKTAVRDRPQAMRYAYRHGLAQPPSE
jgi:DNA-binding NarL/FixJ family response regulator